MIRRPVASVVFPAVEKVKGITYYRCGGSYYMQAYGSSGPIYMPVQPPAS